MSSITNNGSYITWPWYIATTITVVVIVFGGFWGMMQFHAGHPHSGAVTHREFDGKLEGVTERLKRIESKVDSLTK